MTQNSNVSRAAKLNQHKVSEEKQTMENTFLNNLDNYLNLDK